MTGIAVAEGFKRLIGLSKDVALQDGFGGTMLDPLVGEALNPSGRGGK